jgi:hypothetical protein
MRALLDSNLILVLERHVSDAAVLFVDARGFMTLRR